MKKLFSIILGLVVLLIIGGAFVYLWKKSQTKPVIWQTEQAEVTDITKKTVATGSIVPRHSSRPATRSSRARRSARSRSSPTRRR